MLERMMQAANMDTAAQSSESEAVSKFTKDVQRWGCYVTGALISWKAKSQNLTGCSQARFHV